MFAVNSDHLRYLIELSKSPSINIASQKLHITPQALSIAIKKLENELGFSLLNRSFKGISLTENGQWLVQESLNFLTAIEERKRLYQTTLNQSHQGNLDIYVNYSGMNNNILGQLTCMLYQQEPNLTIKITETGKELILDAVKNHLTEFGFIFRQKLNGSYTDEIDASLTLEPIFSGNPVLLTAPFTDLAKFNSVTLKKVFQYPLCIYHPYADSKNFQHYFLVETLKAPIQYVSESNFSIYKEKIQRGIANSLSMVFPIETQPYNYIEGCKIVQLRDDIKIFFGFIKNKSAVLSENARFFIQSLKELATISQNATQNTQKEKGC